MSLKGTKTEENLKDAFAGESQANRRYLYFAQKADIEGYNDVASVFRSTAEGETGHAHGHLEYLEEVGDPATGLPMVLSLTLNSGVIGQEIFFVYSEANTGTFRINGSNNNLVLTGAGTNLDLTALGQSVHLLSIDDGAGGGVWYVVGGTGYTVS